MGTSLPLTHEARGGRHGMMQRINRPLHDSHSQTPSQSHSNSIPNHPPTRNQVFVYIFLVDYLDVSTTIASARTSWKSERLFEL